MANQYSITAKWKWYHGLWAAFFGIGFFLILYGMFGARDMTSLEKNLLLPLNALLSLYGVVSSVYHYSQTFIIDSKGIYFRTFGYTINAGWKDVKRIGQRGFLDGLIINKRFPQVKIWFPGELFGLSEVIIPLSLFNKDWRYSELGRRIKKYVPHLFKGLEK